jgi:hypothetical protein
MGSQVNGKEKEREREREREREKKTSFLYKAYYAKH